MTHMLDMTRGVARVLLKLEWKNLLSAQSLPDLRDLGYQPALQLLNSIPVDLTAEQESNAADACMAAGLEDYAVRLLYCLQTARELAEAAGAPLSALMLFTALIRAVEMLASDSYPVGQVFYAASSCHRLVPFLIHHKGACDSAVGFLGDLDVWSLMLNWRDAAAGISAAN